MRLSPQQRRLWILGGDGVAPMAQATLRFTSPLDRGRLAEALALLIARHEILRTRFRSVDLARFPLQATGPASAPLWRDIPTRRSEELHSILEEERASAFLLDQGPLLRVAVAGAREPVLALTLPALCADVRSLDLLLEELCVAYESGGAALPPTTSVQYSEYAAWQNELFEEDGETEESRTFWQRNDPAGSPDLRATGGAGPRASVEVPLQPGLRSALVASAARLGVLAELLVLAAWRAVLGRLLGRDDVLIAVQADGRKFDEVARTMGPCAKLLPFRFVEQGGARFVDLVAFARSYHGEAIEWQETYVWGHDRERGESASHWPAFAFDVDRPAAIRSSAFLVLDRWAEADRYEAALSFVETREESRLRLRFDPGALSEAQALRLLRRTLVLLEHATSRPDSRLAHLDMVPSDERALLLERGRRPTAGAPAAHAHERVEAVARTRPDRIAVEQGDESITFRQLDVRADRLAAGLRGAGVRAEDRVGLYLPRSIDMVVAVLGVLKAGGAFVPLPVSDPPDRLAHMIEDAEVRLVLTAPARAQSLPRSQARAASIAEITGGRLARRPHTSPEQLAYIIYTSGSTGAPKGCMISHGALARYLTWCERAYAIDSNRGSILHSALSFDLTLTSLFAPLISGKKVVLTEEGDGVEALARALEARDGHMLLKLTPSHLRALVDRVPPERAAGCAVVIGGEALTADDVRRWHARAPGVVLINEYGPTETVVGCVAHRMRAEDIAAGGPIPIGAPIDGAAALVLDERMRLLADSTPGELYVGGDGVGRGYAHNPRLTAERFLPDPFSEAPGARCYRTGDRVQWRPDGALEFLGRCDRQIKLRGYRIEPGEIEAALLGHESVRAAAVIVSSAGDDAAKLSAFVEWDGPREAGEEELQRYLGAKLPPYMVPSQIVARRELPITRDGKVDYRALANLDATRRADAYVAPRTGVEQVIAELWAEALRVPRVGAHDDFFAHGGHSLLAAQVVARIRGVLGVELPLNILFEAATVARIGERVQGALGSDAGPPAPIERLPRGGPLPISLAQEGIWRLEQVQPGSPVFNIERAVHVRGALDVSALGRSLCEVVRRHEVLRTGFEERDGRPALVRYEEASFEVPVTDLSTLPEPERDAAVQREAAAEARAPFDLRKPPLIRARLFRLHATEHVLVLSMHHIASDGWSIGVLLRELAASYRALSAGRQSPVPELDVQYADYAAWQRRRMEGERLERHLSYWRRHLEGAPAALDLPTDRPRPSAQSFRGAVHRFELGKGLQERLQELSRREGATLFMTMLAAWKLLLSRWSGRDDIVVGSRTVNRTPVETERLIGCFVNLLALRTRIEGEPSFRQVLGRVREAALGAYAHQELPFERLVDALVVQRRPSQSPIFQVMFNLQNSPALEIELPDLALRTIDLDTGISRLDLTLTALPTEHGLRCELEYSTELFEQPTMERTANQLRVLLEDIVTHPDRSVRRLAEET